MRPNESMILKKLRETIKTKSSTVNGDIISDLARTRSSQIYDCDSRATRWLLLEGGDSFRGSRFVEKSHVLMHLWKTLLHVILSAALPHCSKTKTLGRVVQLTHHRRRKGMKGGL